MLQSKPNGARSMRSRTTAHRIVTSLSQSRRGEKPDDQLSRIQRVTCAAREGCGVLDGPTRDVDRHGPAIEKFDEIIGECRSAVATAAVNLADDDVGR